MNETPDITNPAAPRPFTGQDVADAIDQLNHSERGRAAAVRFRKLLEADDQYACGLDTENWRALETIVKACRVFGAYKIREFLPKR